MTASQLSSALAEYAARRDDLLARIAAGLEASPRFRAAWLAGSLGRGAGDALSDLDLFVAVDDTAAVELCAYPRAVSAGAPDARMELFRAFGDPLNIHENHRNAPRGGSFSAVLYRDPPVLVDWVLVPQRHAGREADTRLLTARAEIPEGVMPPQGELADTQASSAGEDPEQLAAERLAFFWMMAAVASKYIARLRLVETGRAPERNTREMVDWVLPFLGREISGVLGGPLSIPENSMPGERLRLLCDQVELRMGQRAPARAAVETILALGS